MIVAVTPTHITTHLTSAHRSLLAQVSPNWRWVILANGSVTVNQIRAIVGEDARVIVRQSSDPHSGRIGALKKEAFVLAADLHPSAVALLEFDHDDLLTDDAVVELHLAFADQSRPDFVYSNCSDFIDLERGVFNFYGKREQWAREGWRYRNSVVRHLGRDLQVAECVSFKSSARAVSLIYTAPNHLRAWRRDFYLSIGGHDASVAIADDHELLIRTYLRGTMMHVDKCLYLYRMGAQNSFAPRVDEIRRLTWDLYCQNIEKLLVREGEIRGLPCLDLGAAHSPKENWTSVDVCGDPQIKADLRLTWPWADSSVMAFRAHDFIEHLPDKSHTMREMHRCLVPGGVALISVPSTDGRGAWQDPTHVSFWNENSFWYWTRPEIAKYVGNDDALFIEHRLFTGFNRAFEKQHCISHVKAELLAWKNGAAAMAEIPGRRPVPT